MMIHKILKRIGDILWHICFPVSFYMLSKSEDSKKWVGVMVINFFLYLILLICGGVLHFLYDPVYLLLTLPFSFTMMCIGYDSIVWNQIKRG